MAKIVLISCASKKRTARARAADLYTSTLFRYCLQYARQLHPAAIFILSAKYGLLPLDDEVEPYNTTLNKMPVSERKIWATKVIRQLQTRVDLQQDHFIVLAGKRYRQYLLPHLASYEIPLEGLSIGKQLQYLVQQLRLCNRSSVGTPTF